MASLERRIPKIEFRWCPALNFAHADVPRNANASATVLTITMLDAPFTSATAAVVNARNTSMTATVSVARTFNEALD
jgi:hypothetical protein